MAKKRILNLIIFLILTVLEVLIALFVHDNFIRPFVGDVIVVAVIYYFIRIFFPDGIKYLLLYIFIFCTIYEFSQLLGLTQLISGDNEFLRILFGSTFDVWDIVCYAVGCTIIGMVEWVKNKYFR